MNEWIKLYQSGKSSYEIAKQYNTYPQKVRKYLIKNGVKRRTTSEAASWLPVDEIIKRYKSGESARSIATSFKSTITSITDLLKRYKIGIKPSPKTKADWSFIYNHDQFFFYWLGWMLSDGCISYKYAGSRNRGIITSISVQTSDSHIIEFFKSKINPKATINKMANARQLAISIPRIDAEYLNEWGLIPRKSMVLAPTDNLLNLGNKEFYQMLIGYIEGDGHVSLKNDHNICSGSKQWLEYLVKKIDNQLISKINPHNGSWRLRWGAKGLWFLLQQCYKYNIEYKMLKRKWDRAKTFPMFFDDELRDKPEICNHIKSQLSGKSTHKFKLRPQNCQIKLVSNKDIAELYNKYHYIGAVNATNHIGVYYSNELIAGMSIGRPQRNKSGDWEILRMVCNFDYIIHGLWSYLLKWVQNNKLISGKLITFSDDRISFGNVYQKMGMSKEYCISPDYYWVKDGVRYHKSGLRKKGDEKKLKLTEKQLRHRQGYEMVYDVGKTKWSIMI